MPASPCGSCRVSLGKVALLQQTVDLHQVVSETLQVLEREGRSTGYQVKWAAGSVFVHGDPARLEEIVRNLLDNAFKYTPRGGRVAVSVAEEGGDAVFRVKDTGIGIPADMLTRIFDVFVQQPRALDRAEGASVWD